MSKYIIREAVLVLDENSDVVDWFDTIEDAEEFVADLEREEDGEY